MKCLTLAAFKRLLAKANKEDITIKVWLVWHTGQNSYVPTQLRLMKGTTLSAEFKLAGSWTDWRLGEEDRVGDKASLGQSFPEHEYQVAWVYDNYWIAWAHCNRLNKGYIR